MDFLDVGGELNQDLKPKHARRVGSETIRCARCANLALLMLEGVALCHVCAVEVAAGRDIQWIEAHSSSLDSKPPPKMS